jgi:hypothetical protein
MRISYLACKRLYLQWLTVNSVNRILASLRAYFFPFTSKGRHDYLLSFRRFPVKLNRANSSRATFSSAFVLGTAHAFFGLPDVSNSLRP